MSSSIFNNELFCSSDDDLEIVSAVAFADDSSDDVAQTNRVNRRRFVRRNTMQVHQQIFNNYFSNSPVYHADTFRRRFRMRRDLFLRILNAVERHEPYFVQRRNHAQTLGLSPLQKVTAAMRILAYGIGADFTDEYVIIGETTALKSLKYFVKAVISVFGDEYLRTPNDNDTARLLAIGEQRGFPGMLGSIDCMHWKWKNCPTAWSGLYIGHVHEPTIILEAVASYDLWIWHAFFGLPGSNNDINVLENSNVCAGLTQGRAPQVNYSINGHNYTMGYYLADGIYPSWSIFVKTIHAPQSNKRKLFASAQESARKDVERAFGVLQARFAIVRGPARYFNQSTLKNIMMACTILHNMIVEDERDNYMGANKFDYDMVDGTELEPVSRNETAEFMDFRRRRRIIRDRETHSQLQLDIIEHQWMLYSQS